MTALLYYSISSDLTKDEIIAIDERVAKNREGVYLFVRKLPSNSKCKAKRLGFYIVFISILSGIFFVIYRQSDKKGFRRWWTSFKTAIIFSAIAAGLIPVNTEAIEPPGNNNQVYQERLLSDQEFNSFEDNDQKVILVKTGDSSSSVPTSPGRGQPSQFPTPPSGGRPSRPVYVPKYRTAPKVVPGLGAAANPNPGAWWWSC